MKFSDIGVFLSGGTTTNTTTGGGTTTATKTNWGALIIAAVSIIGAVGICVLIFEETKGAKS